ncbi:MAG: phosphatidate cytidylyltransferase [Synechococcales cyanobacterium RM1_1_8]|nr:phosphatidate cytidylyltransferase [Synechococcales cyanobacterium RM1_1_8]
MASVLGAWPLGAKLAIAAGWLALVGGLAWSLDRRPDRRVELTRKVVHIGTGNVILLAWLLAIPAWVGMAASLLFGAIALLSYLLPLLPGINSVGRRSFGTFFYALSIGLLVAWFWPRSQPQFAALGILIMTWGDGLAGLVGRAWGRHGYRLAGMEKSWEGSATMAVVSGAIAALLLFATGMVTGWAGLGLALAIGLGSALLEAFSPLGIDNLTVPLGSAALAWFALGYRF